jgi:hypothetical protein
MKKSKNISIFLFVCVCYTPLFGQEPSPSHVLDVGIRLQKTIGLYTENGFTVQYTHQKLVSQRLYFGFSYVSSRLGTAINSNAIQQDNFLLSGTYYFRPKRVIRSVVKVNLGYFTSDLGDPVFDELPNTSLLASPELGICYCPAFPLKIQASIGYNLITGNGIKGPGTLYPVFVQTSITWNILKKI